VLGEPLVGDLAQHATSFGAPKRQTSPLDEHRRGEWRARADDQGITSAGDDRLADGPERVARALPAGRAEHDRVVLVELVGDHLGRIAGSRDEPLDALVVRTLAKQLVERLRLAPAVALGDVEQRDGARSRSCELDPEPRGELRVPAAADRNEDALRARGSALHDGEIAGRLSQDRFDRRPEDVPSGAAPANDEQVGPLGRAGLPDRIPGDASDDDEAAQVAPGELTCQCVERAAPSARFGLRRGERGVAGDLDRRRQHDLAVPGECRRRFKEPALALWITDRDDDLHAMPSSTSGTTGSARTRDHAIARTRERKRGPGPSSDRSIASAMTSPDASGGTYVAASPASARRVSRSLHTMGSRWRAASSRGIPNPSLWLGST